MCHSHALSLQSQCHWQPWGETIMNKPLRTNVALNESLSPPTSCFIPRLLLRFIINGDVQAWENLARHWERKFSREFPRYLYIDVVLFTPENLIFLIFHSLSRRCISAHVALLETKSQGFPFNPYRTENFTSFFSCSLKARFLLMYFDRNRERVEHENTKQIGEYNYVYAITSVNSFSIWKQFYNRMMLCVMATKKKEDHRKFFFFFFFACLLVYDFCWGIPSHKFSVCLFDLNT